MNNRHLYKAKRLDNGEWIEGYYAFDCRCRRHMIFINEALCTAGSKPRRQEYSLTGYDIDPSTLCQCTGKNYMDSDTAYEGDIFESQASGDLMILRYGTYQAYCPADKIYMDSVGFYAECKCHPDMPIGCLEDYALKKGNVFDSPELLEVGE